MSTEQSPNKKRGIWFVLIPIIIIGILAFSRIPFSHKETSLDSETATAVTTPAKVVPETPHSVFSPEHISSMIAHDEDSIAGVCINAHFVFSEHSGEHHYSNSYHEDYEDKQEKIITWPSQPHRIIYSITDKKRYDQFIEDLNKLSSIILPKDKRDTGYLKYEHLLSGDCVFIKYGYSLEHQGNCIIAIRKNEIISAQKVCSSSKNDTAIENYASQYLTTLRSTHFYDGPGTGYRDGYIPQGKRVSYSSQKDDYIYCTYTNDAGITVSGWILSNDVTRTQ